MATHHLAKISINLDAGAGSVEVSPGENVDVVGTGAGTEVDVGVNDDTVADVDVVVGAVTGTVADVDIGGNTVVDVGDWIGWPIRAKRVKCDTRAVTVLACISTVLGKSCHSAPSQ